MDNTKTLVDARVHTLVVAAGKGSRFGADIPKQYVQLNDKPILLHSLVKLASSDYINHIFLVVAKDDNHITHLPLPIPVTYVIGGAERWQSVLAGVAAIGQLSTISDNDLVLIHDAARPAVTKAHINKVIQAAAQETYGAILAVPVVDTIKKSTADNYIQQTLDRRCLWQAQTPQVFRFAALRDMLAEINKQNLLITDEASGFELLGHEIRLVEGSTLNIKLTRPEDKLLLQAVLSHQIAE
ncbi:2-C-methyl-D-erythritol 4-phosphate cytidylyltransferase [Psychrobacter sp. I-STPA10]|uniref:2-C-methyl-D-erythritol 4-phosphate cytidylyltransferase n=1 Tax=Psychrobacter sp. I-STPA10 TaxID=2585769 RepID=UPI001E34A781|nr:2-C-methyl-D-erythritol 4-phosphate cytidylyltransferase [Psychrobacter sp. I-STPA10]